MKTRKILSLAFAILMLVSCMSFVTAEGETAPGFEVGDGYLRINYSDVYNGICDNKQTASAEKNVEFEGKKALKVTPTPNEALSSTVILDSWDFSKYEAKVEVPRYKYATITYYYDTDSPAATGNMQINMLPGSSKALKSTANGKSAEELVTGKWTTAIFNFSGRYVINEESDKNYVNQIHIYPYGNAPVSQLTNDVMYIADITFYEKNPDPNAVQKADFAKGNPDAVGEAPASITFKTGEKYTLPENPFELAYGTFKGWKSTEDGKIYAPGTEITGGEVDVQYAAAWEEQKEYSDSIAADFTKYQNGIVDRKDSTTEYVKVDIDGKSAMKIVPNPDAQYTKSIALDGWSYKGLGVDFDAYKYIVVSYKYESPNPVSPKMRINIMKNGNILKSGYGKESTDPIVSGVWSYAVFDMSDIDAALDPDNAHILCQMHIYPFGDSSVTPVSSLTKDDIMYIDAIMFFKNKPDLGTHEPYMTGYDDGTFKPNKTMSRAEACTVVARLLASEDDITGTASFTDVAADKWYAKYIGFCEAKGLLKSYSGTFAPDKAITRAEFAELVYNTGLAKDTGKEVKFTDVTEAHPRYAAIKAAASAGLITGYADGTFLPDRTITRAQVVTVINRARGRDMTPETITGGFPLIFLDVDSTNWAFANIAEAAIPHIAMDGRWIAALKDPADMLGDKYSPAYDEGNAKVAEVDKLAEERKNAILATESDYSTITGTKYYVSPNGDDNNDGTSPETAWKTINKAVKSPLKAGDGILLERGGVWREKFTARQGITYSAYGEGAKPVISGSPENGADASKWTLFHEDKESGMKIWTYSNTDMTDVGEIVFNDGAAYSYKEVPSYVNGKFVVRNDRNTEFDVKVHLDHDLKFFHKADSVLNGAIPNIDQARGTLYLRCDKGNPGEVFKSIEFNTRTTIVGMANNTVFDNLSIMYGGSHGIGGGTTNNITVKNCVFGWIGGSVQYYNSTNGNVVRFGNGVEIYGGCDNYTIENCYIYQNYDAGVTHQYGNGTNDVTMNNVTYKGNLIEDCVYNIEYFLGGAEGNSNARRDGKNHLFEDNILRRAGYGFGSTRPDGYCQAHIKSWGSKNSFENYVVRNNIFDRSVQYLFQIGADYAAYLPKMEGNTYIQGYKNILGVFGPGSGKSYDMNITAASVIANEFGDATGKGYIVEKIPYYSFDEVYKTFEF